MSSAGTPCYQGGNEPGPLLTVTLSHPLAGIAVCTAAGEVDMSTAPLLGQQLQQAISSQPRRLVVNLSAVTFFSAAGVGALDEARAAQRDEHELVLVGKSRVLKRVLDVCDVGYPRYCDLDRAVTACSEDASA
ncbi:MAG: STAS domain-containing protein [Pseudonocardiaceae bacterium]|nr:STAS domain-containing protein [Pseudonocardiaceae bacterium]